MKNTTHTQKKEQGVALLFVILLTSVLMLVSIGITNISFRQAQFSVQAKDSDKAFFAADTGMECALYLDHKDLFGGAGTVLPECNGNLLSLVDVTGTGSYVFALPLNSSCAEIAVNKGYTAPDGSGPYTQISSIGYSFPGDPDAFPFACVTTDPSPRIVTRALRTSYLADGGEEEGGGPPLFMIGGEGEDGGSSGSSGEDEEKIKLKTEVDGTDSVDETTLSKEELLELLYKQEMESKTVNQGAELTTLSKEELLELFYKNEMESNTEDDGSVQKRRTTTTTQGTDFTVSQ